MGSLHWGCGIVTSDFNFMVFCASDCVGMGSPTLTVELLTLSLFLDLFLLPSDDAW